MRRTYTCALLRVVCGQGEQLQALQRRLSVGRQSSGRLDDPQLVAIELQQGRRMRVLQEDALTALAQAYGEAFIDV